MRSSCLPSNLYSCWQRHPAKTLRSLGIPLLDIQSLDPLVVPVVQIGTPGGSFEGNITVMTVGGGGGGVSGALIPGNLKLRLVLCGIHVGAKKINV